MGFIENGRIQGLIPEKTLFAVNYPGYPSSLDRAVETLGGQEAISKVWILHSPLFNELVWENRGCSGIPTVSCWYELVWKKKQGYHVELLIIIQVPFSQTQMHTFSCILTTLICLCREKGAHIH